MHIQCTCDVREDAPSITVSRNSFQTLGVAIGTSLRWYRLWFLRQIGMRHPRLRARAVRKRLPRTRRSVVQDHAVRAGENNAIPLVWTSRPSRRTSWSDTSNTGTITTCAVGNGSGPNNPLKKRFYDGNSLGIGSSQLGSPTLGILAVRGQCRLASATQQLQRTVRTTACAIPDMALETTVRRSDGQ